MSQEILINEFDSEEMQGMCDVAVGNLLRKMPLVGATEKIQITDIITTMKRNLKDLLLNKNN
jgi:hypothetical protein